MCLWCSNKLITCKSCKNMNKMIHNWWQQLNDNLWVIFHSKWMDFIKAFQLPCKEIYLNADILKRTIWLFWIQTYIDYKNSLSSSLFPVFHPSIMWLHSSNNHELEPRFLSFALGYTVIECDVNNNVTSFEFNH